MDTLVSQGIELAMYGMGTVFLFLSLLVVATRLMSSFILRYYPDAKPAAATPGLPGAAPDPDPRLLAVISAAIQQHRSRTK